MPVSPVEYIEDFTDLQTHESWSSGTTTAHQEEDMTAFTPSQWSSVIIQMDRLATERDTDSIPSDDLVVQLQRVGAVVSRARGENWCCKPCHSAS